jgi:putative oxidoreductase
MKLLQKYEEEIYALLRIVIGFLFIWHGTQKLFGFPPSSHNPSFLIKYVAGGIEFVGGFFVMIGFLTRWSAFFGSGLMAFAYWMAHGTNALLPIQNRGELAVLYCFIFLFIAAKGAGKYSLDKIRRKK